ncbi:MAG: methyltransferase domain-containing protein [Planctomycetaceae bacterium]|nr:methyltransferase domain-containing protein [Planctomycetaceae bacterium]
MTDYLMEDDREARRLSEKVVPQEWVDRYLRPLNLHTERILDVGCGPAVITAEIGRRYPRTQVVGIDASPQRIDAAQRNILHVPNVSIQLGDAHILPFDDETFDLVVCRFLLEYLKDKPLAVTEMKRVLRPGGRLLLQDLDGQLIWHDPPDDTLQRGLETVLSILGKSGFDPLIGRKLFHFCQTAGFESIQVSIEPYHLIAGSIDAKNRALWKEKLHIATKSINKMAEIQGDVADLSRQFLEYLDRPDTMTYSVLFSVLAIKPE